MYIVTGGAGFIGSNLVNELVGQGEKVFVVDNLSTGSESNLKGVELAGFCNSITDTLLNTMDVEGIFHLGMPSSSPLYDRDPFLVSRTTKEFILLQEYLKSNKVKMVLSSTSSLYNGNPLPWKEGMPIHVTSYYSEARCYLERLAELYNQLFSTQTVILRLFSVYGPGEDSKMVFANLITQLIWAKKKGEPFPVYGDGEQTRDVVFVSDVVDAFIRAMRSNVAFDVFNVGTGVNNSVNKLAELIGADIQHIPNPLANYVQSQLADATKISDSLGWKPVVSIEEGIKCLL